MDRVKKKKKKESLFSPPQVMLACSCTNRHTSMVVVAKIRFGAVAVALEMVPIANLVFMWTNIVGCALWVADEIEKEERSQPQQQQQQQQQIAQDSNPTSSKPTASTSLAPPSNVYLDTSPLRQHHEPGNPESASSSQPSGPFKSLFSRSTRDSKNGKQNV